jgi:chaperonin GroEL
VVVDAVKRGKGAYGFDAYESEYGDMIKKGILDPTKVVRTAIENASSIASMLLTTESLVADIPEPPSMAPAPPPMDY